jgi:hypothetical protein
VIDQVREASDSDLPHAHRALYKPITRGLEVNSDHMALEDPVFHFSLIKLPRGRA